MTPAMHSRERAARLALLSGESFELVRVRFLTAGGRVHLAALTDCENGEARFMIEIAHAADRRMAALWQYTDEDRHLFDIPVSVTQRDGGGWLWRAGVDIWKPVAALDGGRVLQIAGELAGEILPIVAAAADSGELFA